MNLLDLSIPAALALPGCLGYVVRQWRLHVRDERDRGFAWHIFDHTRSTEAMAGYSLHVAARNAGPEAGTTAPPQAPPQALQAPPPLDPAQTPTQDPSA